ncbi:MAG: hypothetical protein IKQ17_09490 [Kiritimatiellae bacterium]|nr:hypothetical protein [Kiritimatiellia bacterium]
MKSEAKRKIPCPPKCLARRRIVVGMGTSPAVLANAGGAATLPNEHNR